MVNPNKKPNVKSVFYGSTERQTFSKISEVVDMPNLIEVQKKSFEWFVTKGLKEIFYTMPAIEDYSGRWKLSFSEYRLEEKAKYSIKECKERDTSYSLPLYVKASLIDSETGEIKEDEVYLGDLPIMTDSGTFVINGAERVVVSQLVRSPGAYYKFDRDKTGKELFNTTVIPNRGAWLEYATEVGDNYTVRIDKNRKIQLTTFLRALDFYFDKFQMDRTFWKSATNEDIINIIGNVGNKNIESTFGKDQLATPEDAITEVYKKLRPGEPVTVEGAVNHLEGILFSERHYDLSRVGRYKYNKKFSLKHRILGRKLAEPVINTITGEFICDKDIEVDEKIAQDIENNGIISVSVYAYDFQGEENIIKVLSNGMVDIRTQVSDKVYNAVCVDDEIINEMVSYRVLKYLEGLATKDGALDEDEFIRIIKLNMSHLADSEDAVKKSGILIPNYITLEDIFASANYLVTLGYTVEPLHSSGYIGKVDDIDHLGNRRIRQVGELMQERFRIGLTRMERHVREKMATQSQDETATMTPLTLVNNRAVTAALREFFGSSPLSQFMDQTNPLSELTHKRRLSALGPGGLSRDRAGFEVRDVHYTHYGRMCPIETPEGPNIGLISYLATYARINNYGFIETPFRKVEQKRDKKGDVTDTIVLDEYEYMTADVEDNYTVAQANEPLTEDNRFKRERVNARCQDAFLETTADKIDYMDVSPKMVVSVATAMIPFLENDDTNRALMGSNMQKQAVPLMKTENPFVATGIEYKAAVDSGSVVLAKSSGVVEYVSANRIKILDEDKKHIEYVLTKNLRSNHSTCVNQKPIVVKGQQVQKGEVIADGPATDKGEVSLGKNALIGFMTWEGYNYEDAVLINERLCRDDVYTSIHIEEYTVEARETKLGAEDITRDIPNVGSDAIKELDENGVIRIGAEVKAGDILVGKLTPKGEVEQTPQERLLKAIFGEKSKEVRDTSLRLPHGSYGTVVDIKEFTRETCSELGAGVNKKICVYIAQKRKLSVGDKMAGRHGNKGVVSRILKSEDMPYLPDGTPLDIVLNPLGVPSRMNIGQVLEVHLGLAAKALGWKVCTPVFDGAHEQDIRDAFAYADEYTKSPDYPNKDTANLDFSHIPLNSDGKIQLFDGRTGEPFDNKVTVGYMYYLKLHHLVDDKIHARSIGPYSLVTQQPLGGKAQFGGQRFGEMEVWALEAYGAAYTLQEILTVKSDDVVGRVKTYEAITKGQDIPPAGIPESFKVLIKELQSLALDVKVYDEEGNVIDLKQGMDEKEIKYRNAAQIPITQSEGMENVWPDKPAGKSPIIKPKKKDLKKAAEAEAAEEVTEQSMAEDMGFADYSDYSAEDVSGLTETDLDEE